MLAVKLSSYKQERIQTYIFCGPTECWNFSSGILDFHKSTLIHRPLPKVGFCSCSWTTATRGWNQFTISCRYHSWYWNLSAYYLCIGWQDFSQVSWHLSDAGSSNSHFYSWIDGKFLCCKGTKTWDVYGHLWQIASSVLRYYDPFPWDVL